ncbi:hypothetical protein C1H46_003025 [Malus baccata]|uniref:Uncharacterized protein n=1 Tax=Malus baccata TaxID=106549 RepID=A0A540NJV3_MALBA|nr:hypothetical protein C1H46_003025 [Malus baccata]
MQGSVRQVMYISHSRASQTPSLAGSVVATFPLEMGTTSVPPVTPNPTVSTTPASSTSLVTHHVLSARWTHRRPRSSKEAKGPCRLLKTSQTTHTTTEKITIMWDPRHRTTATKEQHNALAINNGSVIKNHYPLLWESRKDVPPKVKEAVLHELSYVNDLCTGRFTQWKSDLYKHYEKYDDSEVTLAVECPIELVDRRDEWEWFCGHFQDEKYLVKKVNANSINRSKKKLLHRSSSRRFSYRLEERREVWGSNPSFVARSITRDEHSFVALRFAQRPPIPSRNIHFARRSTFLRRAMSNISSFEQRSIRRPMFPETVFTFA